jgi:hypothetical protein
MPAAPPCSPTALMQSPHLHHVLAYYCSGDLTQAVHQRSETYRTESRLHPLLPSHCHAAAAEPARQSSVVQARTRSTLYPSRALPVAYNQIRYVQSYLPCWHAANGARNQPASITRSASHCCIPEHLSMDHRWVHAQRAGPSQHHWHTCILASLHGHTTPTQQPCKPRTIALLLTPALCNHAS